MRRRMWILALGLLCLAGALLFWYRPAKPAKPRLASIPAPAAAITVRSASTAPNLLTTAVTNRSAATNAFAWRLSNTPKTLTQLTQDRHAVLLENALIDTANPLNLSIPQPLKSHGDPGAYIVQARGPINNTFRMLLAAAGAQIVSYIPNDAYLVRINAGGAGGLAGNALVQSVVPYEPYYKVQSSLMPWVGQSLPPGATLNLGLFPGTESQADRQIQNAGGQILSQTGDIVRVKPGSDWTALAQLPAVHIVEPYHERVHANDISRALLGVSADTLTSSNYLGLTGKNVMVAVDDSGIDATHPDFSGGGGPLRVFGDPGNLVDTDGHGTHVAGIIAGDGTESLTVTNAEGSIIATPGGLGGALTATNNQFRGKAPAATLLSLGYFEADQFLQESAAMSNVLISNNSWNYGNDFDYDLAAASYDAAVRDALPEVMGSQPVLFVFSAGNSGSGDSDDGSSGNPDTILSPATAKNVITVGALEELRNITNLVTLRGSNNVPYWQPETDSATEVARFSSLGNVGIGTEGELGRYKPDVVAPGTFVISPRSAQWDELAYYNPTNYNFTFLTNQVVEASNVFYYGIAIPENTVGVSIQILPQWNSPVPFPTNLPIYVALSGFPIPTNPATYDFVTWSNEVSIPPNAGGNITDITSVQAVGFNYAVGNTNSFPINYDLLIEKITTNDLGNYFQVLSNLNNSLDGDPDSHNPPHYYRYESGTSMSAADVSGVLALMQDYFTNVLGTVPSPALLKALLINGARNIGHYKFGPQPNGNHAGWGLPSLPNSLPPLQTTNMSAPCDNFYVDQTPTNGLATGDSRTYLVSLDPTTDAQLLPLRVTLTWTDPPGDPSAAIKLVNSLELIVTNLDDPTNLVYYGNDIGSGNVFNNSENASNTPPFDVINNVQNIYISPLLGTNYSITVLARRVNVNAVTAQTNDVNGLYAPNVVQDFALVVSCGEGEVTNAFMVTPGTPGNGLGSNPTEGQQITYVANANAPLLNQFVGASAPELNTNAVSFSGMPTNFLWTGTNGVVTLGQTNQWHFYVVTNTFAADFTNAAFVTFLPPTLAIPRGGAFAGSAANATRLEADIDMYVSTDPALTNLDPVVLSNCIYSSQIGQSVGLPPVFNGVSLGRGGTEFVVDTNSSATGHEVYYVGIYSEDQEAAEYEFIPVFSNIPFSQPGPNGSQIANGIPVPVDIPDGNPALPGVTNILCLALFPMEVQRVVMTNTIEQQNAGDLVVSLVHSQNGAGVNAEPVVLMNHDSPNNPGTFKFIYDDSELGDFPGSQPSDGPGSLNGFVGQQGDGPWILSISDSALGFIGTEQNAQLLVQPHQDLTKGITGTIAAFSWFYDYIDVPAGSTNLTFDATNISVTLGANPVFMYVKLGGRPTVTNYDEVAGLTNGPTPPGPGNSISIGPPLAPGRYWVGLFNPNPTTQDFYLIALLQRGAAAQDTFTSGGPVPILDDAVTTTGMSVTDDQILSKVEVALRVDHPRVSDLVFHLISPHGTRCLLVENRGGSTANMGATLNQTNIIPVRAAGGASPQTNVVSVIQPNSTLTISYNFYQAPDQMWVIDQGGNLIFDSGMISGSGIFTVPYTNSLQLTIVMNPLGNPDPATQWDYTVDSAQGDIKYLVLTEDTTKTTTPIKFAPVPLVPLIVTNSGTVTNYTYTNTITITTNTSTVTNLVAVTNFAPASVWHSSFETTGGNSTPGTGQVFPEGWHVDSGDVDVLAGGLAPFNATPDEGGYFIDLNGSTAGQISTNIPTTVGLSYVLHLAYAPNAITRSQGTIPQANVVVNGTTLATLVASWTNTWTNLNWQTTSVVFTATSPSTNHLVLQSLTPGAGGVLFDELDLSAGLTNGFENTVAGDYIYGINAGFGGWTVTANQVSVVTDTNLAYSGSNFLALADGTITRNFPTQPNTNYILTFAYRGPGAVGLWRGETNANDSINGNNGTLQNTSFTNGEVGNAFYFDPSFPDCRVMIADQPVFYLTNSLTIEGWINPIGGWNILWRGDDRVGFDPYFLMLNANNQNASGSEIDFGITDAANNFASVTNVIPFGGWIHVAATLDGNSGQMKIYTNGVLAARATTTVRPFANLIPADDPMLVIGNVNPHDTFPYHGDIDEISLYSRALSASEVAAIYNHGGAGKYNTNAPSISQGLAEAQVAINGTTQPAFFGNNTNWQIMSIPFTTGTNQTNSSVILYGLQPGMLLDSFVLSTVATNAVVTNIITYTTNTTISITSTNVTTNNVLTANDLYYLPEETLTKYQGENVQGQWQLEIQDDRAGAGLTNTLVSWQLRFNFATNTLAPSIGTLTNGQAVTNLIPPGGMEYYLVIVPPYADMATNRLLSATGPVNIWFNPTNPPVGANPPDYLLIPNSIGPASSILTLTSSPTNFVSPGTYYLGIQNTGTSNITYGIEVDFHLLNPPILPSIGPFTVDELSLLTVTNTATNGTGPGPITYSVSMTVDYLAMLTAGWPTLYASTAPGPAIDSSGVITWTPSELQGPGVYTIQTVATDSSVPPVSATNSFNVIVNEVNTPPFFLFAPTNQTVPVYATVIVTNTAGDADLPPNPLTYTLINPPIGMTIDTNGIISWTPTPAQAFSTNVITTSVSDFSPYAPVNQSYSITNTFTIIVGGISPPFAFTEPATSVAGTSAQLNGMVTPNGPPNTVAWFQWGTSATYGNQTPPVGVGGSFGVVYVSSQLTNLVMNQPYHYRVAVSNVTGVVYGFDQIFDEAGVVSWGADYAYQTNVPPGLTNVVAIAGAFDHSLAAKNDGTVVAWGDNTKSQTNVPAGLNGVVAVAGGQYYSLALLNSGTVVPWGGNLLAQTNVPPGLNAVVTIAGGTFASLALQNNGRVVSWGANFYGLTNVPPYVTNIVSIAGGGYHSLAIKNDGTVLAWGNNNSGQTNVPAGLTNVVAIAAGGFHSLALKSNGTIVAWGDDSEGQLDVPPGLSNVVAVAAGSFHSLALKNDGSVVGWGYSGDGETNIPVGLSNVVAITSGQFHNLALASAFNVNLTNTPPAFAATPPAQTLNELATLTVTNSASDPDLPPQTLTYTVSVVVDTIATTANGWPLTYVTNNPPPVIDTNGVITWIPSEAQGPGVYDLVTVVTDNGAPPMSATNSFQVTVNETNTAPALPAIATNQSANVGSLFALVNTATDADLPLNPLTYTLSGAPTNMVIDTNGIITWTPTMAQLSNSFTVTTIVTDTNPYALANQSLSATNQFIVTVGPPLLGGGPSTNTVAPGGVDYYQVNVPANADYATNLLLFATGGNLNVWFSTNTPPTAGSPNDFELITNAASGSAVLGLAGTPPLVPGSTYYLGVQNPNASPVTYGVTVNFHLTPPGISGVSITSTNSGGNNGFWLRWNGPTNWVYSIQWTTNLGPVLAWNTILNPVVTVVATSTNGQFSWFDDGSLTGGQGAMKFYRILAGTNSLAATGGTIPAGALVQAVVTVPAGAAWASNVLASASGPVNVYFNPTNAPTANTGAGDFLMLSLANAGSFVLFTNSVPPIVAGTNYYLAFQNPGASDVTYAFQVSFGSGAPALVAVSITNVAILNNGSSQFKWGAPVSYQFQVQWTTNLTPPIVWNTITNYSTGNTLTSTNGLFTFGDTNAPTTLKFYRLVEYP